MWNSEFSLLSMLVAMFGVLILDESPRVQDSVTAPSIPLAILLSSRYGLGSKQQHIRFTTSTLNIIYRFQVHRTEIEDSLKLRNVQGST